MTSNLSNLPEFIPGLVSVSFRKLSAHEIITLAAECGLRSIEWGGDIHVPPGEFSLAADIGSKTQAAGLVVSAYGSYYRVGSAKEQKHSFSEVARSAAALEAPMIRVWVGDVDSQDAESSQWDAAIQELRAISLEAEELGLKIGMEFHAGSLNNTADASRRLIESVGAANLTSFWQTTNGAPDSLSLQSLKAMREWISSIHVFNWTTGFGDQTPLAEGVDRWTDFLQEIRTLPGRRSLSLEFVKGHEPEQLKEDAKTLRSWLELLSPLAPVD